MIIINKSCYLYTQFKFNKLKRKYEPTHNLKKPNKFQVSKVTAKINSKSTGTKVEESKIRESKVSVKNSQPPINELKEYYKRITKEDQQLAISTTTTNMLKINPIDHSMKNKIYNKEVSYSGIMMDEISSNKKGKNIVPSRYDVIKSSKFGKLSADHSFTSEACIEHVMIFMLKKYISLSSVIWALV